MKQVAGFLLGTYSSTLKMEAICSFEMSPDFQGTIRRYISEDRIHDFRINFVKTMYFCISNVSYKLLVASSKVVLDM
jgi:hypothetical protein